MHAQAHKFRRKQPDAQVWARRRGKRSPRGGAMSSDARGRRCSPVSGRRGNRRSDGSPQRPTRDCGEPVGAARLRSRRRRRRLRQSPAVCGEPAGAARLRTRSILGGGRDQGHGRAKLRREHAVMVAQSSVPSFLGAAPNTSAERFDLGGRHVVHHARVGTACRVGMLGASGPAASGCPNPKPHY